MVDAQQILRCGGTPTRVLAANGHHGKCLSGCDIYPGLDMFWQIWVSLIIPGIEKNSEKEYRKSGEMFYNMEPTAFSRGLIIMPPTRFMPARRPKFAQTRRVMQSISSIKKVGRKSLW